MYRRFQSFCYHHRFHDFSWQVGQVGLLPFRFSSTGSSKNNNIKHEEKNWGAYFGLCDTPTQIVAFFVIYAQQDLVFRNHLPFLGFTINC